MSLYQNPFEAQTDRHALWQMLVEEDIEAFVTSDWERVAGDFLEVGFSAIDAKGSDNPDSWRLSFQTLAQYRDAWLEQSQQMLSRVAADQVRQGLIAATTLRDIEIEGDSALLHKKFDGQITADDGSLIALHWQTIYQCVKLTGRWKIAGFVGYLPLPMGQNRASRPVKQAVVNTHSSAPYSPVLVVNPGQLVVISGQGSEDENGDIVGDNIEAQAALTLKHCENKLAAAGCSFKDVFRVNVYLADLSEWDAFNLVYKSVMPEPRPVRTTVGVSLLHGMKIEIDMWAVKP